MGLLEDLSGDEDDFTALSRDRATSKNGDSYVPTQTSAANFFETEFSQQNSTQQSGDANFFDSDFGEPVAISQSGGSVSGGGVDLLNINNLNSNGNPQPDVVADQLGSLDLGGGGGGSNTAPSNVDLLVSGAEFSSTGATTASSDPVPDLMGGMVDDTFDPFQQFSTPASNPAPSAGTFDPFQNAQVGNGG